MSSKSLIFNDSITMSSREIADLTGKGVRHVHRDIRNMLAELGIPEPEERVQKMDRTDSKGIFATFRVNGQVETYHMDENLTLTLLTGYSTKMRNAVIVRWKQLEQEQQQSQAQLETVLHPHPRINREIGGFLNHVQMYHFALAQTEMYEEWIRQLYRDRDEMVKGSAMFVEALEQIKRSADPMRRLDELLSEHAEGERKMYERISTLEDKIKKNHEVLATLAREVPLLPALANQGPKLNFKKLSYDVWQAQRMGADGQHCYELSELIKP